MRMFVAVRPPEPVLDELAAALEPLRATAPDGLRWSPPAQWHLTLCFLADVPDERVPKLTERLRRATAGVAPMELRLAGGGRFGDRTLWAGTAGDLAGLRKLASVVRRAARHCGLDVERRPYRPHLTLARASRPVGLAPTAAALYGFTGATWRAECAELVHSTLGAGPGGTAVHRTVAELALGGGS